MFKHIFTITVGFAKSLPGRVDNGDPAENRNILKINIDSFSFSPDIESTKSSVTNDTSRGALFRDGAPYAAGK